MNIAGTETAGFDFSVGRNIGLLTENTGAVIQVRRYDEYSVRLEVKDQVVDVEDLDETISFLQQVRDALSTEKTSISFG